jgi:hypothetical protein
VVYANDSNPRDCIVATFAGPIAEYRATREMRNIETDVGNIALCCRELLGHKNTFVENECNYENFGDFFAAPRPLKSIEEVGSAAPQQKVFELFPQPQQQDQNQRACPSTRSRRIHRRYANPT